MARHLIIGGAAATGADGGLSVEKLSAKGPIEVVPGDTIADSDSIRFIRDNGSDRDVVSPWIKGRNVISFSGKSGVAQAADVQTATLATNATAASTHRIKIINKTNGVSPFEMKEYETSVAASASAASQATALYNLIDADKPHWIKTVADDSSGVLTFTGYKKGEVKADGSVADELVEFDFADNMDGDNGTTATYAVSGSAASRGSGDGFYMEQMEKELQGVGAGYYNRVQLPLSPTVETATGTAYDQYVIVATKDGSTTSAINGVDNLIEIVVASPAADSNGLIFEGKLNPWMNSAGFGAINL